MSELIAHAGKAKLLGPDMAQPADFEKEMHNVKTLFMLAAMAVAGYWFYRSGKRTSSRKGYGAGRRDERRKGRRRKRRR